MKKSLIFIFLATLITAAFLGCDNSTGSKNSATTTKTTSSATTNTITVSRPKQDDPIVTTTTKSDNTNDQDIITKLTDEPELTVTATSSYDNETELTTSLGAVTSAIVTEKPFPDPLPGNPGKYGFTVLPQRNADKWFYFEEGHHLSYMFTPQTNIGETLDLSILEISRHDANTDAYLPSVENASEKGWHQQNNGYSSYLNPTTGASAVIAFTAPEDGCYLLEVSFNVGIKPGSESDGIEFLIFSNDKLVYTTSSEPFEEWESFIGISGTEEVFVTLRKGEKAYFVADPLSNGIGDICESVAIQVTHQADLYIDNESTFAFGEVYNNGSSEQGTNGWYSGCVTKGEVISPDTFGSDPIPHFTINNGGLFGYYSDKTYEKDAAVVWQAPKDGQYTVFIDGMWSDDVLISFYSNNELIASFEGYSAYRDFEMTCTLKKGECFACVFTYSDTPTDDEVEGFKALIECVS